MSNEKILYHATEYHCLDGIKSYGGLKYSHGKRLTTSPPLRLGEGVYFCEEKEVAKKIADRRRRNGEPSVVVTCSVKLYGCIDYKDKKSNDWRDSYNSVRAIHPNWFGTDTGKFIEYCIRKEEDHKIIAIDIYGKEKFDWPGVQVSSYT